ncbi:MAG: hypothetical protein WCY28_03035 [Candidatus Shapirobacteria bacterium]
MKKFFYWLPRILAILFIGFISMFVLDIIGEPQWLLALLIHLIPSYFLIAITIIAWKNESLGGVLFQLAGVGLLFLTHFEALIIAIPAFVIGTLFLFKKYLFKF